MTDIDSYLLKCTLESLGDGKSAKEAQDECESCIEPKIIDSKYSKNETKLNQGE